MAAHRVCPWWIGYLLACPIRRVWQNPREILAPHVRSGMTVLEPGPGMGFFTLELLRLGTRTVAVDIQPKMLAALKRRAAKAGLANKLDPRLARPESMGLADLDASIDFALAFAVVHEFPDAGRFFAEVAGALRPGGRLLLAEPSGHVSAAAFDEELRRAAGAGLAPVARPEIRCSRAALLEKQAC